MIHIFIINPNAGLGEFSYEIRQTLEKRKDIEYYIFHTRKDVSEMDLVHQVMDLFEGEKLRFYCCGGQGTLRNMINGFDSFDSVEIAFYPKGLTNDFMKVFGNQAELFKDLNHIIDGKVCNVDYIKTNHGICLNTISIGLDADAVRCVEDYDAFRIFGFMVPYGLGYISGVLRSKLITYEVEIDGKLYEGQYCEIFFGNGGVIGGKLFFENNSDVTDGIGTVVLGPEVKGFRILPRIVELLSGNQEKFDKHVVRVQAKKIRVRRKDKENILFNQDGDIYGRHREWTAEIIPKGIPLVVPKGVEL